MKPHIKKSTYVIIVLAAVFVALGGLLIIGQQQNFETVPAPADTSKPAGDASKAITIQTGPVNPITGDSCGANSNRREIAVMLSGDAATRPLSGIGQADLVVEMPVITGGITRYLALFGCESPAEIGSVRSARSDFIPLALGLDAIFSHWGGSHFALDELKEGVIDNINALVNSGNAFFRKPGIPEPHNGFTTYDRLTSTAAKLTYSLTSNTEPYPHADQSPATGATKALLTIPYPGAFKAAWQYDPTTNAYQRFKGGTPEIDKNTGKQVSATVIVVLTTDIHQIEGQYNSVTVVGQGRGVLYQAGGFTQITWRKDRDESRLLFLDANNTEVAFVPGKVWFEYVPVNANVSYEAAPAPPKTP